MGLFNQFVSAAVRQIGRDGGKIISNKIYGSTLSNQLLFTDNKTQYNSSKDLYSYADQGFEEGNIIYHGTLYFKLLFGHWLWLIVIVPIPILGLVGSLIFTFKTFFVKHFQTATPLIWKAVQVKDGRKKEGFREVQILTPDLSSQKIYQVEIPKVNKIYSILAILISIITTSLFIWVIKFRK